MVVKRPISNCSRFIYECVFDLILVEFDLKLDIGWFFNVQFMKRKWSLGDSMKVFVE